MDAPKRYLGLPLTEVGALNGWQVDRLNALSVTRVEELLGLIAADPVAASEFLDLSDLVQLQADAEPLAVGDIVEQLEEDEPQFALGALPPPDVAVEEIASGETFAAYASTGAAWVASPPRLEVDGVSQVDCFGPVKEQAERFTCVAFSVCALLECMADIRELDLAEQYAYWNAKEHDGYPKLKGTLVRVALERALADGICDEATWPYQPLPVIGSEGQGPPPPEAEPAAAAHRPSGIVKLDPLSSRDIRAELDAGRPVAISIPVYKNWHDNPATRLYGTIPMPLPNSALEGGHAMCVAGYGLDDDFTGGGYFIVRNSWGVDWAPQSTIAPGYGALPFSYVDRYGWEAFGAQK